MTIFFRKRLFSLRIDPLLGEIFTSQIQRTKCYQHSRLSAKNLRNHWQKIEGLFSKILTENPGIAELFFRYINYGLGKITLATGFLSNFRHSKFRQLNLPTRKCWRIIEGLLNFPFGIVSFFQNKSYSSKKIVVVANFPSNIHHSNSRLLILPLPVCERWREIELSRTKNMDFEKAFIVPCFNSNISQSNFRQLDGEMLIENQVADNRGFTELYFWYTSFSSKRKTVVLKKYL